MMILLYIILYLMVIKNCNCYNADTWKGVDYSLGRCLRIKQTYIANIDHLQLCFQQSLYKRYDYHSRSAEYHEDFQLSCGILNTGIQLKPATWTVRVFRNLAIVLSFPEFHLPCSTKCKKASVNVWSRRLSNLTFCGKRVPWNISLQFHIAKISYLSPFGGYNGFYFILVYEAVDLTSSLLSLGYIDGFFHLVYQEPFRSFFLDLHSNSSVHNYYFLVDVQNRLCVKKIEPIIEAINLYNGPGPLAELIKFSNKTTCLSGYYGFIKYMPQIINVNTLNKSSTIEQSSLQFTWFSQPVEELSKYCQLDISDSGFHMKSSSIQHHGIVHCVWKFDIAIQNLFMYDEIYLNRIFFYGVNHLSGSLSDEICQYGGLYIRYIGQNNSHGTIITLCENNEFKVPLNVPHLHNVTEVFFIFSSYHPYSWGLVDISYVMTSCTGFHYEIYNCNDNGFQHTYFVANGTWHKNALLGGVPVGNLLHKPGPLYLPTCTEIWLLNNLDNTAQIVKCLLNKYFQFALVGTFRSLISHWVLSPVPIPSVRNTNFILYASTMSSFPINMGAAASSLGSAVSCRVEGRAIDTALGQCFIPNSSH